MATTNIEFGNFIDAWVKKSNARMLAIFKESTQRTVDAAQDRIPVETGFARASIRASLSEMPPIIKDSHGEKQQSYSYDSGEVSSTIAAAQIGDTINIGWTASYVGALENGHSKKAPSGFVGISVLEFPRFASEATAEAKARVSSANG